MVFTIKLTTAAAAAVTAMAPSCATAGGGAIRPHRITIARRMAIEDLRLPIMHDEKNSLKSCMVIHLEVAAAPIALTVPDSSSGSSGTSARPIGNFAASVS